MRFFNRRRFLQLVLVSSAGFHAGIALRSPADIEEDWPLVGYNQANTGHAPGVSGPEKLSEQWHFESNFDIESSPVIAEGIVFIASEDRNLYALDLDDGELLWSEEFDEALGPGAPGIWENKIFLAPYGSDGREIHALDIYTGDRLWTKDAKHGGSRGAITTKNGVVYSGESGHVVARDAETGDENWEFFIDVITSMHSAPAVVDGSVYFGTTQDEVYSLDAETGDQEWRFQPFDRVYSDPAVVDGVVYIGSDDGYIYAIDTEDGEQLWRFDMGSRVRSSPAIDEELVYVAAWEKLAALDFDGSLTWEQDLSFPMPTANPAVVENKLYVPRGNKIYCYDTSNGSIISTFETGDTIDSSSPAVSSGTVFIGSTDNHLYALSDPELFEISISIEGEGTTNPQPGTHEYQEGEEVALEAIPDTGWEFVKWSGDIENEDKEIEITVEEYLDVLAEFGRQEFELSIGVEGEGSTNPEEGQYTHEFGEEVSINATPDDGWEFSGWAGDIGEEDQEIELTIEEDTEIIAEFERQEYELTIEIDGEGSTSITEGVHTYEFEEDVELEATPADGWEFAGWTGDVESEAASITVAIEEDMEIIAHFSQEDTPTPTPTPSPTPGDPTPTPTPGEPTPTPTPPSDDPTPSPTPVDDDGIPGPGIVGTVGSLVGTGYVLKWWTDKQDEAQE